MIGGLGEEVERVINEGVVIFLFCFGKGVKG